ncbi:hypothetical protein B0H21DRAFT_880333 [Amylocystis lapponica]|nr:hypothetical protein B0H21DRAFT_880333 [Amylocystis lapponica]
MDPNRPRHPNADRPPSSRRHPDDRDGPQRSLPSIHQLHPDLPPASMQPSAPGPSYAHHQPPLTSATAYPVASGSSLGTRPAPDDRDSDPDADTQEPPKKKRRRQALSCTECKRRKIKCDRAQPCGPCARRGEHNKCQWHIIEPMEKYVTRTEYDELRSRVDELETFISHIPGFVPGRMAILPPVMTQGPVLEPVKGTAITPYHQAFATTTAARHTAMPSARSPTHGEPPPPPGRPPRSSARSPPSTYRPLASSSGAGRSQPMSPVQPARVPHSPTHPTSTPQPGSRSPTVATSRRASLSLAAITTPFVPDMQPPSQPKNCHAQTLLPPGQRLRQAPPRPGSAPAAHAPRLLPHPPPAAAPERQAPPILA